MGGFTGAMRKSEENVRNVEVEGRWGREGDEDAAKF